MDHFIKPIEHYTRRIDPIRDYVDNAAMYLHLMSGQGLEECQRYVTKSITTGKRRLTIPQIRFLQRGDNGDREPQSLPFNTYLARAMGNGEIVAPTMTTYMPIRKKRSLLAGYIAGNLKLRSAAKSAMFQAEIDGLEAMRDTLDSQQTTFKIKNNSLSGAQCSPFTPMFNKTGHSTLTSVCRTATSYANANNEKFLYGNRHYYSPDIVKANLISIITHSDYELIGAAMQKWNLRAPSAAETMECIRRGTRAYWRNPEQLARIGTLVENLNDMQRSAFVYTADLYHLAQYNPDFVKGLLERLAHKATTPILDIDKADAIIKSMDDNLKAFVAILCADELKGKGIKEARERPHDYGIVAATVVAKLETLDAYADVIKAFWVTDNLPSSIFSLPSVIRRGVLTSDTDSTIFSTQEWVKWTCGKIDFSPKAIAVANSIVYIVGQLVRHILATMCGNMGVEESEIFRLKMKNEFYFPVFALTSRAKHYYAYMAAREGLVFETMKSEIKGVALRSSAVSTEIIGLAQKTMFDIMDTVMRGEQVQLLDLVRRVATIEREVLEEVSSGSFEYFKRTRIQDRSAYKAENGGNYQHYELWEEVFASKYGHAPQPPYSAIKASLVTGKRPRFKEWLDTMSDPVIAERLRNWAEKNNKLYIGTILMPQINLVARGVPKEISEVVDTRSLVAQLMESFYLILEGLGVYARNKKITRLISDDRTIQSLPEGVLESVKARKKM